MQKKDNKAVDQMFSRLMSVESSTTLHQVGQIQLLQIFQRPNSTEEPEKGDLMERHHHEAVTKDSGSEIALV
jgi:hypothetical protein